MPIRPIDMMSVAPRSQEASQQHVNAQHKAEHAQQSMAQQFSKHVKAEAEVVIETSKSEQNEYRYDAKEKGNNSYSGQKKRKGKGKKGENAGEKTEEIKLNSFDIRI